MALLASPLLTDINGFHQIILLIYSVNATSALSSSCLLSIGMDVKGRLKRCTYQPAVTRKVQLIYSIFGIDAILYRLPIVPFSFSATNIRLLGKAKDLATVQGKRRSSPAHNYRLPMDNPSLTVFLKPPLHSDGDTSKNAASLSVAHMLCLGNRCHLPSKTRSDKSPRDRTETPT